MRENAEDVWRWLQDGAHFYVCGDANADGQRRGCDAAPDRDDRGPDGRGPGEGLDRGVGSPGSLLAGRLLNGSCGRTNARKQDFHHGEHREPRCFTEQEVWRFARCLNELPREAPSFFSVALRAFSLLLRGRILLCLRSPPTQMEPDEYTRMDEVEFANVVVSRPPHSPARRPDRSSGRGPGEGLDCGVGSIESLLAGRLLNGSCGRTIARKQDFHHGEHREPRCFTEQEVWRFARCLIELPREAPNVFSPWPFVHSPCCSVVESYFACGARPHRWNPTNTPVWTRSSCECGGIAPSTSACSTP